MADPKITSIRGMERFLPPFPDGSTDRTTTTPADMEQYLPPLGRRTESVEGMARYLPPLGGPAAPSARQDIPDARPSVGSMIARATNKGHTPREQTDFSHVARPQPYIIPALPQEELTQRYDEARTARNAPDGTAFRPMELTDGVSYITDAERKAGVSMHGGNAGAASKGRTAEQVVKTIDENGNPVYTYGGGYDPYDQTLDPNFLGMRDGIAQYREPQAESALDMARRVAPDNMSSAIELSVMERQQEQGSNERRRQDTLAMSSAINAEMGSGSSGMSEAGKQELIALGKVLGDITQSHQIFGPDAMQGYGAAVQDVLSREPQSVRAPVIAQMRRFLRSRSQFPQEGFADGGEISELGQGAVQESVESIAPQEQGAAAGLDSGDYVIPVEALRFYGSKFFKDLIEKAESAEA